MRIVCVGAALFLMAAAAATAQETKTSAGDEGELKVVVTANRFETPVEETTGVITVIDEKQLEEKQIQSVSDALRGQASVDVVRSGGPGGNTAVFMRGANSEHTLVLIDGIEANNPITTSRQFNFTGLSTEDVERIEILRGPQSVLYGSDALGGVINVITKKGEGPASGYASAEAGSYDSYAERAGVSGSTDMFDYSLAFSRQDTGGISAAGARYGNKEHDAYDDTSFATRLGFTPSEVISGQVIFRYSDADFELDNQGGVGGDDLNRVGSNEQYFSRAEVTVHSVHKVLKHVVGFSLADQTYRDDNDPDVLSTAFLRSKFDGLLTKTDLQNIYSPTDYLDLILGLENKAESGSSQFRSDGDFGPFEENFDDRSATTNAVYLNGHSKWFDDVLIADTGIRWDDHSRYGDEVTWRIAPVLRFEDTGTKLLSSVATGFKAPSLFQLYSQYGSTDLDAEKVLGVDAGIEQELGSKDVVLGVAYFHNSFDDLINFDPNTFKYFNVNKATTQGLETYLNLTLCDYATFGGSYSYTDATDDETGTSLLRRARNKLGGTLSVRPVEKLNFSVEGIYVGRRFDTDFSTYPAQRTTLGGYTLVNLATSYEVTENVSIFARLDNVFDREYEDVLGYGSFGAAAYGGVRVNL